MAELWLQVLTRSPQERVQLEKDYQLKMLADIATYCEYQLQQNPEDAKAHCHLGVAKSSLGRREEAIKHLLRASELDTRYDEPHLHLGILWFDQDRYQQAQHEFETAERLNPNNYLAHGYLGLLHMNQGNLQAAETHLRAALQLNPNDGVAQENLKRVLQAKPIP